MTEDSSTVVRKGSVLGRDCIAYVATALPHSLEYPSARPLRLLSEAGMDVVALESGDRGQWELEGVQVFSEPTIPKMLARVRRLRPQLVFAESVASELIVLPLAPRRWVHNPSASPSPLRRRAQQALLSRAHAVSFTNDVAHLDWRLPPSRLVPLPSPVDRQFWSARVERDQAWWGWDRNPPTGPVVVHIGNLYEVKQQVPMLRALIPLLRNRQDLTFVIAGNVVDESVHRQLQKLHQDSGLGHQVRIIGGHRPADARQLLAWSQVSIVNSRSETQCMTLYESLMAGVPATLPSVSTLTSAFPASAVHQSEQEMRSNVLAFLSNPELGAQQVAKADARLAWADVSSHDEIFWTTACRLLA